MTLAGISLIIALAIIVEALIEYFGGSLPSNLKALAGASVGATLCVAYQADGLAALGLVSDVPLVGQVLTGLLIGRGSNVFNDLVSRLREGPQFYSELLTVDEHDDDDGDTELAPGAARLQPLALEVAPGTPTAEMSKTIARLAGFKEVQIGIDPAAPGEDSSQTCRPAIFPSVNSA